MVAQSLFSLPQILPKKTILLLAIFFFAEWLQRNKEHTLQLESLKFRGFRWSIYCAVIILILSLRGDQHQFIYFQF